MEDQFVVAAIVEILLHDAFRLCLSEEEQQDHGQGEVTVQSDPSEDEFDRHGCGDERGLGEDDKHENKQCDCNMQMQQEGFSDSETEPTKIELLKDDVYTCNGAKSNKHVAETEIRQLNGVNVERGGGKEDNVLFEGRESGQPDFAVVGIGVDGSEQGMQDDAREPGTFAPNELQRRMDSDRTGEGMQMDHDDRILKAVDEGHTLREEEVQESSRHLYVNGILTIKRLQLSVRLQADGCLVVVCEEGGIFSQTLQHGDEILQVNSTKLAGKGLTQVLDLFHECLVCMLITRHQAAREAEREQLLVEIASPLTWADMRDLCRRRLISFYKMFNPQRLRYVDDVMNRTDCDLVSLNASLRSKGISALYGDCSGGIAGRVEKGSAMWVQQEQGVMPVALLSDDKRSPPDLLDLPVLQRMYGDEEQ
eukprot:762422-Hanusia_phi.AAC.2